MVLSSPVRGKHRFPFVVAVGLRHQNTLRRQLLSNLSHHSSSANFFVLHFWKYPASGSSDPINTRSRRHSPSVHNLGIGLGDWLSMMATEDKTKAKRLFLEDALQTTSKEMWSKCQHPPSYFPPRGNRLVVMDNRNRFTLFTCTDVNRLN